MNNEYVVINKTVIEKRIEEWEAELQECYKAPVGKFNHDYVSTLQQAIVTAREILSQSTPLVPELQKTWNAAYIDALSIDEETYKPLFFEDFISNLKLDI